MSQQQRVLDMLKKRPKFGVKNYEFSDAGILNYTGRISDLRRTHKISTERLYRNGKATGTFVYRLVQPQQPKRDHSRNVDGMKYEYLKKEKSKWFNRMMKKITKSNVSHG